MRATSFARWYFILLNCIHIREACCVCDTILCHCMCVWSERLASKTIYKLHIRASEIRITYSMMILTSVFGFSKCIILLFLEEVIVRGIIASRFICGESFVNIAFWIYTGIHNIQTYWEPPDPTHSYAETSSAAYSHLIDFDKVLT